MTYIIDDKPEIRIGISTCLLGYKVRHDGGHKHDRYITDILGNYCKFVRFCPEIEVGMGVPRETVRLVGSPERPRMIANKTQTDWTDRMKNLAAEYVDKLKGMGLSGYIVKKDSPSCGMERVKLYSPHSPQAVRSGRGMFTGAIMDAFPMLPVEEEGRLNDARIRENFIVRIFAYHRLQELFRGQFSRGAVVEFHAAHKLLIMAHNQALYTQLGQLVAAIKKYKPADFKREYMTLFMIALGYKTTTSKNVNVLHHILGYLKKQLTPTDKQYIVDTIEDYRKQIVPLIVPITLLKHHIYKFNIEYIRDQIYLHPHPKELMLRNHV